jgi:hemerythrin-like domain-containing protein
VTRDPIERLLSEHRVLMAKVSGLREAVADLERRGDAALANALPALEAASAMIRTELAAHSRREDDALFPALEAELEAGSPTAVYRDEHRAIHARADLFRHTLRELNEVEHPAIVAGGERLRALTASGGRSGELRAVGSEILELLDRHFAKEELVLFPMAREVLAPRVLGEVARRMDELDDDAPKVALAP